MLESLSNVGHALRNHRTLLMKTVCEGRLVGRRRKGRPPISLVTNLTTACGLSLHQIVQKSQDRAGWQQKVILLIATANTASGYADRNASAKPNFSHPVTCASLRPAVRRNGPLHQQIRG
ncbi:hypothetical protein ElyMa_006761200 [Elysia marginata]|uniref:Uncharacterized protein n=1 Tax=Elysia marginata TaxID=1093978 RepID=A0AAV4IWX7_9GAST|nr:hypothetical protein ElyMa_006761200 [Elysia marginata]